MSGEDDAQPVLDDRTRALIASLIETGIETALAARPATLVGDGNGAAAQNPSAELAATSGRAEIRPRADDAAEIQGGGGDGPRDNDGPSEAGEAGGADAEEDDDAAAEDGVEDDDDAGGPQAFSSGWYEARRGRRIPPRFEIPRRFDPQYPVAFPAESVAHFQLFGSGNASAGRAGEAAALYSTAAYLTEIANDLAGIGRELESVEAIIPSAAADRLREARWALSNSHFAAFGTYELAASRYELLCGLQGASGVADPALLGTFLDAPAAYSSAGRQAFRRQQQQAVKSAAQVAGRRQVHPLAASSAGSTGATAGRGGASTYTGGSGGRGGRVRTRNQRGGRGGGSPAAGAGTR
jgi:hypothetical protein